MAGYELGGGPTNPFNNQYKITDTKYETVKSKIDNYVNLMKEVLESKHECGIKFMSYVLKYYYSVLIKAQNQINAFIKIKFVSQNDNSKQYHKNMINYFDLIAIFKVFETSNILFSNSFFVDKDDLYNYEEDSEEWAKMKKIVYRIHAKNKYENELNILLKVFIFCKIGSLKNFFSIIYYFSFISYKLHSQ